MKSIDEEKETTDTTSQAPQRGRGRRKRKQEPNEEDQEILSDDSQSTKRKRYLKGHGIFFVSIFV